MKAFEDHALISNFFQGYSSFSRFLSAFSHQLILFLDGLASGSLKAIQLLVTV